MALDLFREKGTPLSRQRFTWREVSPLTISKLNDDAFTRVRIILMNGLMSESLRFQHAAARMNRELQLPLAQVRRSAQHQQTMVNWLLPADQSPLETTIGFEQVAIEVTASVAQKEPDPYQAQCYRFGLLEDFDHMYRYSALMDRVEGRDANNILQSYTDVRPGRPTVVEHRAPEDDLRKSYDRNSAALLTKLHALTLIGGEYQTHDYYMTIGPLFADPVARALYAEIASIEEQHVTQYESMADPDESWLEKWLLHEANEAYNYWSCVESEGNARVKAIWERFLDYELGQFHFVAELFEKMDGRDPAEIITGKITEPIEYKSHREYVREVLKSEVDLRAIETEFVRGRDSEASKAYRDHLHSEGTPSEIVATGYRWTPGTEQTEKEGVLQEA